MNCLMESKATCMQIIVSILDTLQQQERILQIMVSLRNDFLCTLLRTDWVLCLNFAAQALNNRLF